MNVVSERGRADIENVAERAAIVNARSHYALNKHLLRDPQSRRLFRQHAQELNLIQSRVLGELQAQGISVISLDELFGHADSNRWAALLVIADRFLERVFAGAADDDPQPVVAVDDPLFRLGIEPPVLAVVNSFYQLWSKLNQYGMKISLPKGEGSMAPRIGAQSWHRDQWEQVKLFLYLTDVDERNGALEYIPESRRGGRYADLCPMPSGLGPEGYLHTREGLVEERVPEEGRIVCSAPRGSLVFCDSAGLHRGGYAVTHCRLVSTWAYYRPSAKTDRDFRCVGRVGLDHSFDAASFALA